MHIRNKTVFVAFLIITMYPHTAHANYIDPSTGGILLQIIFGGLAGLLVMFRILRHQLYNLIHPKRLVNLLTSLPSRIKKPSKGMSEESTSKD